MCRYRGGRATSWVKPELTTANSFKSVNVYADKSTADSSYDSDIITAAVSHISAVGTPEVTTQVPMLTSNCPGWICYAEKNSPQALPYISTVKSPQQIIGTLVKTILLSDIHSNWSGYDSNDSDRGCVGYSGAADDHMDCDDDNDNSSSSSADVDSINFDRLCILDSASESSTNNLSTRAKKVFIVSIQPCFDKKLEASRKVSCILIFTVTYN